MLIWNGSLWEKYCLIYSVIRAAVWMAACLLNFKHLLQNNTVCARALLNDLLNLDKGSVGPFNAKGSFDTSSSPATNWCPCRAIKEWLEGDVQQFVDREARILHSSSVHYDTELLQSCLPYLTVIKAGCVIQHIYRKISFSTSVNIVWALTTNFLMKQMRQWGKIC